MSDDQVLELAIDTVDEGAVVDVEQALSDVNVERWPGSRDIGTILTLASTAVSLVNALLVLKDRLLAQKNPPQVTVKNPERQEVLLISASREDLERLLGHQVT